MKQIKRALSSKAGFTLTELLASVAIMGILFAAIVVGINSCAHVYRRSVSYSDAQTLTSTVATALENELRYARNIKDVSGKVSFDSDAFGSGVSVDSDSGHVVIVGAAKTYQLLSDSAYTNALSAAATVDSYTSGVFTVTITVTGALISTQTTTLSIRALNP